MCKESGSFFHNLHFFKGFKTLFTDYSPGNHFQTQTSVILMQELHGQLNENRHRLKIARKKVLQPHKKCNIDPFLHKLVKDFQTTHPLESLNDFNKVTQRSEVR